MKIEAPSPSP
jgi:hypothetical protein